MFPVNCSLTRDPLGNLMHVSSSLFYLTRDPFAELKNTVAYILCTLLPSLFVEMDGPRQIRLSPLTVVLQTSPPVIILYSELS